MAATLTILIPTYKRPYNLANLLSSFSQILLQLGRLDVKILVSDNQSDGNTQAVVHAISSQYNNICYFRHEVHYETGEENLFFALPQVVTDYVWFFSDDDLPDIEGVKRVLNAVSTGRYDFIQLNTRYIDNEGRVIVPELIKYNGAPYYETTIDRLVASQGWLHLSAMFSASVMRTNLIASIDLDKYIKISPIYAHVAAYLEAFSGRPALFIAFPSVSYLYGLDFEEGGLWKFHELAKKRGAFFSYFWSLGLIRLVSELERIKAVQKGYLLNIIEVTHHSTFALSDHTLMIVCDQLLYAIANPDDLRVVTVEDIDEIALYYSSAEQRYVDIFSQIRKVADLLRYFRPTTDGPENPFTKAASSMGAEPMRRINGVVNGWASSELNRVKDRIMARDITIDLVGEHNGFKLFSSNLGYIAQNLAIPIDRVSVIGPRDSRPDVIMATQINALKILIDEQQKLATPTRMLPILEEARSA